MPTRIWLALVVLLAPSTFACAADSAEGASRASSPNPNPNPAPIAPAADVGQTPRDMPGAGRGSATFKGK